MTTTRVSIFGHYAGQLTMNVMHFNQPDVTQASLVLLAALVDDLWINGGIVQNTEAGASWNKILVQDVETGLNDVELGIIRTGVLGDSKNYTPMNAAVFQLITETSGRKGKGRVYLTGFSAGNMVDGYWKVETQNRLNNVAAQLQSYWCQGGAEHNASQGWDLGVCPRTDPTEFKPAVSIVARGLVGVQVRRQIGRGK